MSHRNPLSIGFQLRHRAQHCTTILYKHRFMPTLHINVAHISMSHTYQYRKHITLLQSAINPITRYPSYTKLSFYATSFPRRFHATPTTLKRCTSATILPVSSQLDLRFNSTELFKIIARAVLLSQLNCISTKSSTIMLVGAKVFSKTVAHNSYRLIYTSVFSV